MEAPVLTDKDQFPTDEIIFSLIGRKKSLWTSVFNYISANHSDVEVQWRYYNDGKSWLMKAVRKSKTIFWLSVIKNTFRTTFYITGKAEKAVLESDIPDELKKTFADGLKSNKFHGLTVIFKNKSDLETFKSLFVLKVSLK